MSKRTSIRIPDPLYAHIARLAKRQKRTLSNLIVALLWEGVGATPEMPPYDPGFGDDKVCACGHPYARHFGSYNDMRPVGCKYCGCMAYREDVAQ